MTLAIVIAAWFVPILLLVWVLCRAAAIGDAQIDRARRGRTS